MSELTFVVTIVDTPGDRPRKSVIRHLKRADCVVLVYDVTNRESFIKCELFFYLINEKIARKDLSKVLIGNKMDLVQHQIMRPVPHEEAKSWATIRGFAYFETNLADIKSFRKALIAAGKNTTLFAEVCRWVCRTELLILSMLRTTYHIK